MTKIDFSNYKIKEGNVNILTHIDGVFASATIDSSGTTITHNLGRFPYFVFLECEGNGYAYVASKNKTNIVVKTNSATGITVNVLIV